MKYTFILIAIACFCNTLLSAQDRYELELPDDQSRLWTSPIWKGQTDTIRWKSVFSEGGFFWRESCYEVSFTDGEALLFYCPRGRGCRVMSQDSLNLIERTDHHYVVLKDGILLRRRLNLDNTRIRVFGPGRQLIAEARTRHRILQSKHELYIEFYKDVPYRKELLVQLSRDILQRARRW